MDENLYLNQQDHFLHNYRKRRNFIIILKLYSDSFSKQFSRLLAYKVKKSEFQRRKACFSFHLRKKMLQKFRLIKKCSLVTYLYNIVSYLFFLMKLWLNYDHANTSPKDYALKNEKLTNFSLVTLRWNLSGIYAKDINFFRWVISSFQLLGNFISKMKRKASFSPLKLTF